MEYDKALYYRIKNTIRSAILSAKYRNRSILVDKYTVDFTLTEIFTISKRLLQPRDKIMIYDALLSMRE